MTVAVEQLEKRQAAGEAIDSNEHVRVVGALNRLLRMIGLTDAPAPTTEPVEDPTRDYQADWQRDPLWWEDRGRALGHPYRNFTEQPANYGEVFPDPNDHLIGCVDTCFEQPGRDDWRNLLAAQARLAESKLRVRVFEDFFAHLYGRPYDHAPILKLEASMAAGAGGTPVTDPPHPSGTAREPALDHDT